jgi:hypothetical protein
LILGKRANGLDREGGAVSSVYRRTALRPLTAGRSTGRRRSGRIGVLAAAIVALVSLGGGSAAQAKRAPRAPASDPGSGLARISGGPGVGVTMPPVGLSIEYPLLASYLGTAPCPPPALVSELLKLGSPPLALSGLSQDLTVPNGALSGSPSSWEAATLYPLTANFWSQLHCLVAGAKDPLTVGINVRSGELPWAAQMVAAAQGAATNGLDFSLGNEPDLYLLPNYLSLGKQQVTENVAAVNLYLKLVGSLRQAIGNVRLVGPELAGARHWRGQLPRVIGELHAQTVGVHLYPLSACQSPRSPTVRKLLSPRAGDAPRSLAWVVANATAMGLPAIISEANSVACGGAAGVSDSPASAVWAVRFVLSALKSGFREVRFHLSGGPYDPFIVDGLEVLDRPLQTALVALNRWLPVGSSLRTLTAVPGVVGTVVSGSPRGREVIFDNRQPRAQAIVLPTARTALAEILSVARGGLRTLALHPRNGRLKFNLPGNSVVTVTL